MNKAPATNNEGGPGLFCFYLAVAFAMIRLQ